jgi:hypothetical protein
LKTLVLKLKSIECSSNIETSDPDELDDFVDNIIVDVQNTLVSNIDDLRERVKQARPDPNDPHFEDKVNAYQQLLEQMILIVQNLENVIGRTLDELQILIGRIWEDISKNNGNNVEQLLQEHEQRTRAFINQQWIKHINDIQSKLNTFQ